jgi:FkbM family methyltransferase
MIISLKLISDSFAIKIKGVIQAGCHHAQELEDFESCNPDNILMIEPQPEAFCIASEKIKSSLGKLYKLNVFNCAVGNYKGKVTMNTEKVNMGMSSSILNPKEHLVEFPNIKFDGKIEVDITTIDDLVEKDKAIYNTLVMDCQGYELEILKGAKLTLKNIDIIITEVNFVEVYENCALIQDIDSFLDGFGFVRVMTNKASPNWGDACYIKKKIIDALYKKSLETPVIPVVKELKREVKKEPEIIKPNTSQHPEFNEDDYLELNPDVAKAVKEHNFQNGYAHYLAYGKAEGRSIRK